MAFNCEFDGTSETFQRCILDGYAQTIALAERSLEVTTTALAISQASLIVALLTFVLGAILTIILFRMNRSAQSSQQKAFVGQQFMSEISDASHYAKRFWVSDVENDLSNFSVFELEFDHKAQRWSKVVGSLSKTDNDAKHLERFLDALIDFERACVLSGVQIRSSVALPLRRDANEVLLIDESAERLMISIYDWING